MAAIDERREWVEKKHPDGKIDWFAEYDRLVRAVRQAYPCIDMDHIRGRAAVHLLFDTALGTAEYLIANHAPPERD